MVSLGAGRRGTRRSRFARGLAAALAVGLGLGGVGALVSALPAGADVSAVSFTGASQAAGVTTNWTVQFVTGPTGALAAGSFIDVTFDPGFSLPATPTVTLLSGFSHCSSIRSTAGSTVEITLTNSGGTCMVGANRAVALIIDGVTNPGANSYQATMGVSTSSEPNEIEPTNPVVISSATTTVSFSGASMVTGVVTNWTVGFTTSPTGALGTGSSITVTFASGFGLLASPTVLLGTGFSDCSASASLSGSTVFITLSNSGGTCTVGNNTAVSLLIEHVTNPAPAVYPAGDFSVATSSETIPASPPGSITISGSGISGVAFAGSTQAALATGVTWTVSFVTSVSGALGSGSQIGVTFPSGFGLPANPTVVLVSGFSHCVSPTTAATSGQTVVITLSGAGCTVGNGATVTVEIEGISNPTTGVYPASSFAVQTSSDMAPVSPASAVTIGIATNGSGTLVVSPSAVGTGSSANTLVFTYTAAAGGTSSGTLDIAVPTDWSPPSTVGTAPGYTTTTCGTLSIVGTFEIQITGMTLGSGASCTVTYGSRAAAGPGATAPSTSEISTFTAAEASVANVTPVLLATSPQVTVGSATPLPIQIFGEDPIGTSIAVSQNEFPAGLSAGGVVLARSDYFTDALAGGPLAAFVDGPLLLTEGASVSASLDPRVLAEIERVLPAGGTVYILGGALALSPNIDATLSSLGYHVVREAGLDEYTTAVYVAEAMGNPSTIFEATGGNYFDALSAVPAAIEQRGAILLTNGAQQAPATGLYLLVHPGDVRYAIGGPDQALGADPNAIGVWGATLFGTSAAVAQQFFPGAHIFGIATALSFSDALSGGVFMATGGRSGPLLLVNPFLPLAPEIAGYLGTLAVGTQGYVFGGPDAVPGVVIGAVQGAVG